VLESEQVAQLDSKDMDFATWRQLASRVGHHLARSDVAGAVITHGTDTLEETAYFLSRLVITDKPVVLTGAMRPASSGQADGPRNLADAIALAASGKAVGVVVVFACDIHAARHARKVHPHRLNAFSSGEAGPIGRVGAGGVQIERLTGPARALTEPAQAPIDLAVLPVEDAAWPWVEIVASAAGVDGAVVRLLVQAGVDGIVVAATGNGTLHRCLLPALDEAARRGVRVVRSSRCLDGRITEPEAGAIASSGDLTPVKARIEMILSLLAAAAVANRN
ncbi:MAG: asparaginase, partial [Pseudomonadota bacterium]|nr:asparaginase [Pseudomonadota bacterium]